MNQPNRDLYEDIVAAAVMQSNDPLSALLEVYQSESLATFANILHKITKAHNEGYQISGFNGMAADDVG